MTVASNAHDHYKRQKSKGRDTILEKIMDNFIEHLGLFGILHERSAQILEDDLYCTGNAHVSKSCVIPLHNMSHTGADGIARGYGGISRGGRSMPYSTSHSLLSALSA